METREWPGELVGTSSELFVLDNPLFDDACTSNGSQIQAKRALELGLCTEAELFRHRPLMTSMLEPRTIWAQQILQLITTNREQYQQALMPTARDPIGKFLKARQVHQLVHRSILDSDSDRTKVHR